MLQPDIGLPRGTQKWVFIRQNANLIEDGRNVDFIR
jgi:hypothetical protein